jgi:hypothetical protein
MTSKGKEKKDNFKVGGVGESNMVNKKIRCQLPHKNKFLYPHMASFRS